MTDLVPLRSLVSSYIGGGWGQDELDDSHTEPAYVVRGTDFRSAEYGSVDSVPYRFHKPSNLAGRRLGPGEIVMEVSGGSVEQPVGRVMFVDEHVLGALDGPVMCASFCKRIVPDVSAVQPSFLYWYLQAVYATGLIERYQIQSTGIRNLQFEYLLDDVLVPLPSREEQQRTVAVLDLVLELLRSNRRRIEILEDIARLIYREWFVHFRFAGHEHVGLVDSDLGRIPDGWSWETLADAAHLVMGQSPKSEFYNDDGIGLPFHQGVTNFGARYPEHRMWCTQRNRIAEEGDVLLSVRAPVGRINVAPDRLVIGRGLAALRSKRGTQVLLFETLRDVFSEEDSMGGGTIFKAVTKKDLERVRLVRPPDGVTGEFERAVGPMFDLVDNLTRQNRVLAKARDVLLPRLISGELDTSGLDSHLVPVN